MVVLLLVTLLLLLLLLLLVLLLLLSLFLFLSSSAYSSPKTTRDPQPCEASEKNDSVEENYFLLDTELEYLERSLKFNVSSASFTSPSEFSPKLVFHGQNET